MKVKKYQMGQYVIDNLTGLEGVINAIAKWNSGATQYSVQPPLGTDGKPQTSHWCDPHLFKRVKDKDIEIEIEMQKHEFGMGDKVQSTFSEYTGYIAGLSTWVNGCVQYFVTNDKTHDGKQITMWFENGGLILIEAAAKRTIRTRAATPTGGPSSTSSFHSD